MLLLNAGDGFVEALFQLVEIVRAIGYLYQCLRQLFLGGPVEREAWGSAQVLSPGPSSFSLYELPVHMLRCYDVVTCMLTLMHILPENRLQIFQEMNRVLKPGGKLILSVKNALFERLSKTDRFASSDITDSDQKRLIFTNTRSGEHITAPWYSFSPQDIETLCVYVRMSVTHLRGNTPFSAWIADSLLKDPKVYAAISQIEDIVGDVPPFNYFGYYLLVEAIKPLL